MRYYISDLHFYHETLNTQMDCRGFADRDVMNAYMISQWNSRVRDNDEVVILGDFSVAGGEPTNRILEQLKGKLYLITGNHDGRFLGDKKFSRDRFVWIKNYAEIWDNKRRVILSHYPILCYNGQYQARRDGSDRTYMLYGHVHNTPDEMLINTFQNITRSTKRMIRGREDQEPAGIPCHLINCFCMFSDYIPLSLDEWIENDQKRREGMRQEADKPASRV